MHLHRPSLLVLALTSLLVATGCAGSSAPPAPTSDARTVAPAPSPTSPAPEDSAGAASPEGRWRVAEGITVAATDLASPWSVAALPDGGVLVSERNTGLIRSVSADGEVSSLATVPDVVAGGESGLHGLAVLEQGEESWLYAYHGSAEDNRVIRAPLTEGPGGPRLGAPEVVFTGIPRAQTHNGGRIAFGPDGYLYIATGDAQDRSASQDPQALGGKILRLTPDGRPAPGNPFGNAVWSLGHRNVQGIAWTADGAMWASEFGQNTWDELNRIEPGGNYGWPDVEGQAGDERFIDPVAVWSTDVASPSGIAAVGDTVFMTGLRGARLWAVDVLGSSEVEPVVVLEGFGRLRDAVAADDGSLWVLTNNTDGRGTPTPGDDRLLRVPLGPAS